jgi:hypothetical protein
MSGMRTNSTVVVDGYLFTPVIIYTVRLTSFNFTAIKIDLRVGPVTMGLATGFSATTKSHGIRGFGRFTPGGLQDSDI